VDESWYITARRLLYLLKLRTKAGQLKKPALSYLFDEEKGAIALGLSGGCEMRFSVQPEGFQHYTFSLTDKEDYTEQDQLHFGLFNSTGGYFNDFPLVPLNFYDGNLTEKYATNIQADTEMKAALINSLKIIVPELHYLEPSLSMEPSVLRINMKDERMAVPLPLMGEGCVKLFRILIDLVRFRGRRFMIDEVDAGIHHSRMTDYWKGLLKAAVQNNVQLFCTTHSQECIKSFAAAFEEDASLKSMRDQCRLVELMEPRDQQGKVLSGKKGLVKAYTYHYDEMLDNLATGTEIRGKG